MGDSARGRGWAQPQKSTPRVPLGPHAFILRKSQTVVSQGGRWSTLLDVLVSFNRGLPYCLPKALKTKCQFSLEAAANFLCAPAAFVHCQSDGTFPW